MASAPPSDPALAAVSWDLSPLLNGSADDPQAAVDRMLADAQSRADAFAERHAGKVAELDGPGLIEAMRELGAIQDLATRAGAYAHLRFSVDTAAPENGALLQRYQEKGTAIETRLLFFELEWAALDDEHAERLLATDGLDFCRHHLRTAGATARTCCRSPRRRSSPRSRSPATPPGRACSRSRPRP
jgi:oligoendopeptidase F